MTYLFFVPSTVFDQNIMGSKNTNKKNHNKNKEKKKVKESRHSPPHHDNVINDSSIFTCAHRRMKQRWPLTLAVSLQSHVYILQFFLPSSVSIDKRGEPKDNLTSKPDFLRHYYKIDVEDNKRVDDNTDKDKAEEKGLMDGREC